jgi:hypothetical protein
LNNKSLLIFFSGTDDLSTFIQKDEKSKWQLDEALQKFQCSIRISGTGVKQLRLEEQLFLALSRLADHTL